MKSQANLAPPQPCPRGCGAEVARKAGEAQGGGNEGRQRMGTPGQTAGEGPVLCRGRALGVPGSTNLTVKAALGSWDHALAFSPSPLRVSSTYMLSDLGQVTWSLNLFIFRVLPMVLTPRVARRSTMEVGEQQRSVNNSQSTVTIAIHFHYF